MVIRNVLASVRVPFFRMSTDPDNYFYSMLVQYVPYRRKIDLIEAYNSPREAFIAQEAQLLQQSAYM